MRSGLATAKGKPRLRHDECVEFLGVADRIVAIYPPSKHGYPIEPHEASYQFIDGVLKTPADAGGNVEQE